MKNVVYATFLKKSVKKFEKTTACNTILVLSTDISCTPRYSFLYLL